MSTFKSTALLVATLATGAVACLVSGDAIAGLSTGNALTTNALNENALISNALTENALLHNALTENALTENSVGATASRVRGNEADMVGLALNGIRVDSVRLVLPTTEPR